MLINILRVMITRSFKPFVFQNNNCNKQIDYDVPNLGLYVHVPFCKELCPFCPYYYYKIKYDTSLASKYLDVLIKEIHLKSSKVGKKRVATSLYFGGGSPSLIINSLGRVIVRLKNILLLKVISALNYNLIGDGCKLTDEGAYLFHLVEQKYTNQYIDKTWKIARKTPWPEKIVLY